jgi:mannose-6-phosphate isomerase
MLYPFIFHPIFKERVWGGRKLEQLYGKALPPGVLVGESWEISDRPGDASIIADGPLAGKDLRWVMENHREALMGQVPAQNGRFPWLVKLLDARERLSLQVHPPAAKAAELGGEPKTEMWYVAAADPNAEMYVGLKRGVTREAFERGIQAGTVADCFHRVPVNAEDAMFLPSGRVHAIGAGLVIFEIQQNSDTTYRVFDWNRLGLDGKPRSLHVPQSLASINFDDFEPSCLDRRYQSQNHLQFRPLVDDPIFRIRAIRSDAAEVLLLFAPGPKILGIVEGRVEVADGANSVVLDKGRFCLVPASANAPEARIEPGTTFLLVEAR